MTRDRDMDALAEAIAEAQEDRSSWLGRLGRRLARWVLVKVAPFLAVAIAVTVLLHLAGVDLGWLLMAMFYGSPLLAAAVASFIAHAWRQNTGLTYTPPASQVGLAEPAQPGQAWAGQDDGDVASHPARVIPPTTVTATVLPLPIAELPQAVGQTRPVHYPEPLEEEETP